MGMTKKLVHQQSSETSLCKRWKTMYTNACPMEAYFHSVEKGYGIELPTSTWLILHSSVHLPGGCTTPINFELVEDQFQQLQVVLPKYSPSVISIAKYVEESLAFKLQVQMHFM